MIPEWNPEGLIPPINEQNPAGMDRSPYEVDLLAFIERFAISQDRCQILHGYLSHRSELHRMGMAEGFQWLNGSFAENIELIDQRATYLTSWLHEYNWHRPHASLSYLPPISRIASVNNVVGLHS